MCWIAVFFRVTPHNPVIVAANREESRRRPSQAPLRWASEPPIWAGRDEPGGGTWLGVNSSGLLAAVTNRPGNNDNVTRPSRGLLCLGSLRCDSPRSARSFFVDELSARTYNPFNLLCVSPIEGWVGTRQGDIRELAPGLHILSNYGDIDDDRIPVVREARRRVESLNITSPVIDTLFGSL